MYEIFYLVLKTNKNTFPLLNISFARDNMALYLSTNSSHVTERIVSRKFCLNSWLADKRQTKKVMPDWRYTSFQFANEAVGSSSWEKLLVWSMPSWSKMFAKRFPSVFGYNSSFLTRYIGARLVWSWVWVFGVLLLTSWSFNSFDSTRPTKKYTHLKQDYHHFSPQLDSFTQKTSIYISLYFWELNTTLLSSCDKDFMRQRLSNRSLHISLIIGYPLPLES